MPTKTRAAQQAAPSDDPHGELWVAIVTAAEAMRASPNIGPAESAAMCSAIEKFSAALMGEAVEDFERMTWLVTHRASIERSTRDGEACVRITYTRPDGDVVQGPWSDAGLRGAVDIAMRGG